MSDRSVSVPRRATGSSAVVGAVRRVAAGSVVCAEAAATNRRLRRAREGIIVGLGGEWSAEQELRSTEHLVALAAKSRLIAGLSSVIDAPITAWHGSGLRRLQDSMLSLDLRLRVRLVGWVIVLAVVTHAALLGVFGVRVEVVGWTIRAGLAAAGLAVMWRPGALAAAWKERDTQRKRNSHGI